MQAPEHGARVTLRLVTDLSVAAEYEVSVVTPDATWKCCIELSASSAPRVDFWPDLAEHPGTSPPEWLLRVLSLALRSVHQRRVLAGRWQRHVSRWRPSPTAQKQAEPVPDAAPADPSSEP